MTAQVKTSNGAIAIVVGLVLLALSLPAAWMSRTGAFLLLQNGGTLETRPNADVSGLEGTVGFLVPMPIWLVVALAMLTLVLLFLRQYTLPELPFAAVAIPGAVAFVFMLEALWIGASNQSGATPGIGIFLAMAGLIVGIIPIFKSRRQAKPVPFAHPTE